jgi:tetratricopeptide (TPR) repeat protein
MRLFAVVFFMASLFAGPAAAQPGGPGGFDRAKKAKQASKPDLSVEGFKSAMAMGQARVKLLQKKLASGAAKDVDKKLSLLVELGSQARDLGTLCQDALYSEVMQRQLDEADETASTDRSRVAHENVAAFKKCIADGMRLAMESLQQAVKLQPEREGMDELVFQLGYLQLQAGKGPDGAKTMHYLLEKYPESDYVPEAWLMVAEQLFEAGELDQALAAYAKVDSFQQSRMRPYAKYKTAWCLYNLERWKEAYEALVTTVDMTGPGSAWHDLYKSVLRDVPLFYSQVGEPEKALEVFKKLDAGFHLAMASALADIYFEQAKFDEANILLDALLKASPDNDKALGWLALRLENRASSGDDDATESAARALVDYFAKIRKTRPGLAKKHTTDVKVLLESLAPRFPAINAMTEELFQKK